MKLLSKNLLAGFILLGAMANAQASSVTYDYVGNDFTTFTSDEGSPNTLSPNSIGKRLTGFATFDNGIEYVATSYGLSDGINSITNLTANSASFGMTFDNQNVDTWILSLNSINIPLGIETLTSQFFTSNIRFILDSVSLATSSQDGEIAANFSSPGTWTLRQEQVSAVPVPAALPLMATALGLFGLAKRRKQAV